MTFLVKNKIFLLNIFNIVGFVFLSVFFFSFSLTALNNLIVLILSFTLGSTNFFFLFCYYFIVYWFFKISNDGTL